MKKISFLVPCFNEVENAEPMAVALTEIAKELPYDYEIIFTDNYSTDGTRDVLRKISCKDKHIKVLLNNRNYGMDGRSARNTFKYVSGDVIVAIACDFQEPPELIPKFIEYWEEGYKVVCGQKTGSKEGKIKYACRSLYYKIIKNLSEVPQYEHISGINVFDREVLDKYVISDHDIDFRFAIADMGYEVKLIQYKQQERKSGKSSYNIWRYLTCAVTSMIVTSTTPLRIMTIIGVIMSAFSFLVGIAYLILKLIFWYSFSAGTAPVLIGLFFIGSVQLLFLGIIGEYVGAILRKVTKYPDVVLSEKINFNEDEDL